MLRDVAARLLRHIEHLQAQLDVGDRGTPRQQPVILKDDGDGTRRSQCVSHPENPSTAIGTTSENEQRLAEMAVAGYE